MSGDMDVDQVLNGREEVVDEPVKTTESKLENDEIEESEENGENSKQSDRILLSNLPQFGHQQFKKWLEKTCGSMKFRKLTLFHRKAYVSCHSHENAQKVIGIINGMVVKKLQITAKLAATEPTKRFSEKKNTENIANITVTSAREIVSPWVDFPYEEQLKKKSERSVEILQKLHTTLSQAKVARLPRKNELPDILKPIHSSPRTKNYRNKCEFTVGRNKESEICVGFVGGRFSDNEYFILPVGDVEHIGSQAKEIAKDFESFVKESDLPPFDEFKRVGVWRSLTVREFACDVMLIFNVFPIQDKDKEREAKEKLKERYLTLRSFKEQKFRVTSLYWMNLVSNHDQMNAEHLGGTEHVYETVLNCRFRISPLAFFQTNTAGTNVLYGLIGKACGFEKYLKPSEDEKSAPLNPEAEDPPAKLMKVDENSKMEIEPEKKKDLLLLDICCGTGTIGICILKEYIKKLDRKLFCIGVEIVESAIQDAKKNAKDNLLEKDCYHVAGKAEDVFRNAKYYLPTTMKMETSQVIGVLDPPRAGLADKLIRGIREMSQMTRIVYVSCEPSYPQVMKNLADLCKPRSRKFDSDPFTLVSIQPVDMFPQTPHVEWVITLQR